MRPVHKVRVLFIILLAVFLFLSFVALEGKAVEGATNRSIIERRLGLALFAYGLKIIHDYCNSYQYLMAIELPGREPQTLITFDDIILYSPMSDEKFPTLLVILTIKY